MNAILYVLATGCQWRALPKDLPPRSTVYAYFWEWRRYGVLDRVNVDDRSSSFSEVERLQFTVCAISLSHAAGLAFHWATRRSASTIWASVIFIQFPPTIGDDLRTLFD